MKRCVRIILFGIVATVFALLQLPLAAAGTPAHGAVYVGVANGEHTVYRVEYDYDGANSFTVSAPVLLATLPGAAGYAILPDRSLLVCGQGAMSKVDLATGSFVTASPGNNCNTVALDPDRTTAWVGWKDTALSAVPLQPFGDGSTHAVSGDDAVATHIAFAPNGMVFYDTGGEFELGNVGVIDLSTFTTTRLFTATEATSIEYDAFSDSIIFAAFGKAHQIDPDNATVIVSSRDDSAAGENYLALIPDGKGHLLATRWGGDAALVLIDYSATGLLGDASTRMLSAPIPGLTGLAGGLAWDNPVIFTDGFDGAGTTAQAQP
ncbi:MAG: hypothetical protein L0H70_02765 [Xanthomonadales bacterium]|nr:hypothetical protein [Xanthomonadales bacterium]